MAKKLQKTNKFTVAFQWPNLKDQIDHNYNS